MANKTTYELALEIGGKIQSSLDKSVGGVNKKLDSIGKAAKTAAKVATAAFAAVKIGGFVKDAVSTYADFNQAMASTSAIAGASQEEMKKLENAALEMGKKTTKTATEASEALGYMALAGWDVDTSISALEPVLRLSEATQMDLATCSDLVTDSMSALGLGVDELSDYLNVAVKANNKSNQSAQQLMEAMIGCGGAAKSAGMDYKQTSAALGILANNGVKGAEAGTALNSMLVRMTTKDTAQKAFKELGVSVYDSSGQMRKMQDVLVDVNSAMSGLTQEQKNNYMSAIAGTNYYTQFGYLLDGVKEGADGAASTWSSLTEAFDNSNGALDAMADQMTDTLPGAIARFGSAIDDVKINLCKVFAPMAKDAINMISEEIPHMTEKVTGFVQNLYDRAVPAVENFKNKAVATFEKVKPTLDDIKNKSVAAFTFLAETGKTAFENIKAKIEENKPAIDKVIAVALDLKDKFFEAFEKAKPAMTYIATVALPAVVGAIMKVVDGAATVYQKLDEWNLLIPIIAGVAGAIALFKFVKFAKDTIAAVKATKALVTVFLAQKKAMLANLVVKAKDLTETAAIHALYLKDAIVKGASTAATWAQTAAMTAWNAICAVGTAVTTALGAAFAFLTSPIGLIVIAIGILIGLGIALYKNWDTVKEKASQLGEWIVGVFNNLKEKASQAIQAFADKFPAAFAFISSVFESFKQTVSGIFNGVKTFFTGIIQFFTGVFTGDWSKALDGLKNIFSGAFQALSSLAMAPLNALKGVVKGAFSAIDTATGGKLTSIKNKAVEAFGNIKDKAGTIMAAAKDTISEKLSNIKSAYEENGGGLKGIAAASIEGVKGYYTAGYSFINNLTGGKLEEVRSKFSEKMSSIGTNVSNAFTTVKGTIGNLMSQAATNVTTNLNNMKSAYTNAGGGIKGIAAATMTGVQTITSNAMSLVNTVTGGGLDNMKSAYTNAGGGIKGIVSATMTGIQSTTSSIMSGINTLTGGKLDQIRDSFSTKLDAAKTAASEKFESIKSGISEKIEGAKTVVSNGLNAIKNFFSGCKLELPSIKIPHFNISGGEAPWGIAGKGSTPKISVDWYKNGGILTGPTIFGANGNSLMGGGEAGKEAVLPLSELWSNMKSVVAGVVSQQPDGVATMFNQVKQLVGGQSATQPAESATKELYNNITTNNTVNKTNENSNTNDSSKFVYSPSVVIQGNADQKDVERALDMSQAKFNQMMAEYQRQKGRTSFA
ncbi:phage tail tape measure protein [Lacrimispora indolis]|uniref:phage tail tape measure protein n=1 Tax=Lacrimispora indolis TaxID=69825 RepID=UPI0003F8B54C|nr:phage tail tape measure protein [[Clostridium] methoxybenzovorans]